MRVVSDSSPLIFLAKIDLIDLLPGLYPQVSVSPEVYDEVVMAGAGIPGSAHVRGAAWIEVKAIQDWAGLAAAADVLGLGVGETSTIALANELGAELVLMDDLRARRAASGHGLAVRGTVGILELLYQRGQISNLRMAFRQLLMRGAYVDPRLLNRRLLSLGLDEL